MTYQVGYETCYKCKKKKLRGARNWARKRIFGYGWFWWCATCKRNLPSIKK